jgi:hypothetical protein
MADIWQFADEDGAGGAAADATVGAPVDPAMSQADVDVVLVDTRLEHADFELEITQPVRQPVPSASDQAAVDMDLRLIDHGTANLAADAVEGPACEAAAVPDLAAVSTTMVAEIDEILFSAPQSSTSPPSLLAAAGTQHLQLVHATAAALPDEATAAAAMAKARDGEALSPDEAARAMDALKAMSVEDRTKLFS